VKTNIPKLFEGAFAEAFVMANTYAGELPRVRTWQAIDADGRWSPTADRAFPMIDIRATPPRTDENAHTQSVSLIVAMATDSAEDQDHSEIAAIYEEVQAIADSLYADFLRGTTGQATAAFNEHLAAQNAGGHIVPVIGGFSMGEPMAPYIDSGANVVGLELVIHYSRQDL